ncbi:MAG: cysteinyl-tRNA synthetase [Chloroflexi bacterium]|nr:cysteinyl-tRNA synthetase [Chloroflexota bacterium]
MGSGEISASGRRMHLQMFNGLGSPVNVAILETPAGFELNSRMVAERVGQFIASRLSNFCPAVSVVPARRRDGDFSTDDPDILAPLLEANYIFLGPGSPTYLVRHLRDSLAWKHLLGRHGNGATLCLASAAAIAFGSKAMPVYEIFKAGCDPFWADGLDFFGLFGLRLAIVSHWDNHEGGANLDTSHCFIGRVRMEELRRMLDPETRVLGIDEHTGLVLDFQALRCQVMGSGGVSILGPCSMESYETGAVFPIERLGCYRLPPEVPLCGLPVGARVEQEETRPSSRVLELIQRREEARREQHFTEADALRRQVASLGFEIRDTRDGPQWRYIGGQSEG